jgi:predicted RNA-binding protein with PIN domain
MPDAPHIIVDGYNVLLRTRCISPNDENALSIAREELIARLEGYRSNKGIKITVVFDGQDVGLTAQGRRSYAIVVAFSKSMQTADALIKKMIDHEKQARNVTLVTSDRSLANYARSSGCRILGAEEFWGQLSHPKQEDEYSAKYDKPLSAREVEEWLKLFGQEKNEQKE